MKAKRSTFSELLEVIGTLSVEDQEALLEIVRKRLMEERRSALARDIAEANREFKAGKCRVGTPDDIMKEIVA